MAEEWVKSKLNNIEEKIDSLHNRVSESNVVLAKQSVELENHIKRTDLAEENIGLLREELKPLEKHVIQVQTVFKIIGVLATIISLGAGLVKILEYFTH